VEETGIVLTTVNQALGHLEPPGIAAACSTINDIFQKRVIEYGEWLLTEVLKDVPHRQ